jgi:hypothetical protein
MIKKITFFVFLFCLYFGLYQKSTCHSQPAEKFIILNLHWNNNTIRLNSRHFAEGISKKRRAVLGNNPFLYRVLSGTDAVIDQGYFEIPRILHFDLPGDGNEEMGGGRFERQETDFVIKIPVFENSTKVLFYQLKNIQDTKAVFSSSTVNANPGEMIGQVNLQ